MREPYRALVVGCGRIGSRFDEEGAAIAQTHAGGYMRSTRCRLVGLCDTNPTRARDAAAHWGVDSFFTSVREALDVARPDVVSICTPDETHADVLREVLRHSSVRAVLMEKPLALSRSEAEHLARAAARSGVSLAVNYSRRYHQAYRRARAELKAGRIGAIMGVMGAYSRGLLHNGTHWIDLARWLVGEVASVNAFFAFDELPDDPTLDVYLRFDSGAAGLLKGLDQRHYALFEIDIFGEKGRLRIARGPRFVWSARKPSPDRPGFTYLEDESVESAPAESAIAAAVENLLDCIERSEDPLCSSADAVRALAIAEACRRSAESHAAVRLSDET